MYQNLIKEMANKHIVQSQISDLLEIRPATVSDKIQGKSRFYFDEAMKIKKVFFPAFDMEYLFYSADN
ncbi:hypothetical protein NXG27_04205 [Megasphaera paucivorans]|uniref:DNA-binding protein n=1 Tax=Megasphaera paucivorans TaxID=349095 RepID=A0A1G9QT29_9FIRM|nr:DNA-binding protein [Megasphaera paucivorans]SDM14134.1 hypothetical protein SAMN05660299_00271 [Megasphaera paucivorans]